MFRLIAVVLAMIAWVAIVPQTSLAQPFCPGSTMKGWDMSGTWYDMTNRQSITIKQDQYGLIKGTYTAFEEHGQVGGNNFLSDWRVVITLYAETPHGLVESGTYDMGIAPRGIDMSGRYTHFNGFTTQAGFTMTDKSATPICESEQSNSASDHAQSDCLNLVGYQLIDDFNHFIVKFNSQEADGSLSGTYTEYGSEMPVKGTFVNNTLNYQVFSRGRVWAEMTNMIPNSTGVSLDGDGVWHMTNRDETAFVSLKRPESPGSHNYIGLASC